MRTFIFLFTFVATVAFGQTCENYYFLQSKKTIEMSISDKKGRPNGKQLYKVQEVVPSGSDLAGTVLTELYNEKGKLQANNTVKVQCSKGHLNMDMQIFIPEDQAKQFNNAKATSEKAYLEYPYDLKVGDKLKDGTFVINIDNNGLQQKLSVFITERNVEEAEKLTTPAGTWDTFKIKYHILIAIETMGIPIKLNYDGVEWFAPKFGTIKTESKHGSTLITSVK